MLALTVPKDVVMVLLCQVSLWSGPAAPQTGDTSCATSSCWSAVYMCACALRLVASLLLALIGSVFLCVLAVGWLWQTAWSLPSAQALQKGGYEHGQGVQGS
jgi:hypothetical protein